MLKRIRRRFRRLLPCQWLLGLTLLLVITLIVRHNKQNGLRLVQYPKTLTSKHWQATRNVVPSQLSDNNGRSEDWEGVKPTRDESGSRLHFVKAKKDARFDTKAREGEIAKIDVYTRDAVGRGRVNVHIWRGLCCPKINSLRQYPLFPTLPKERLLRHTINSGPLGTWYGQRIMGYIHPPLTGNYTFHLDAHVFAELWLGMEQNAMDVELVAKIAKENRKNSLAKPVSHTSRKIYLEKGGKYFFDVLHVMNGGMMSRDHVNVTWIVPGSHVFTGISEKFLSPLFINEPSSSNHKTFSERNDLLREPRSIIDTEINDADGGEDDEDYEGIGIPVKQNKLSNKFSSYFGEDFDIENQYDPISFDQLPDISKDILSVFPSCSYEPTYVKKRTFKRFEGIWQTHFSSVFPDDGTKELICIQNKQRKDCEGNDFITEGEVLELVQTFTKTIEEKYPK